MTATQTSAVIRLDAPEQTRKPRWCSAASVTDADRMKAHIASSLLELVKEKPFEKITVGDISKRSHVARQTFYNHFLDKNDLVDWMYELLLSQTTYRIGIDLSWKEGTMRKLSIMKAHHDFFSQVYREEGSQGLLSREPQKVIAYYKKNLARLSGKTLSALEANSLSIYCYGAIRLAAEWMNEGGKEPAAAILAANQEALPAFAARIVLAEPATP